MPYADKVKRLELSRRHYKNNKEKYKERNTNKRSLLRAFVNQAKDGVPCMDCGGIFPSYVMDFDHIDPSKKKLGIAQINYFSSLEELKEEIKKCELVCANCHRIRTYEHVERLSLYKQLSEHGEAL